MPTQIDMIQVSLIRYYESLKQILGILTVPGKELFVCKTLELGWLNNQNNISCIPKGAYSCVWTRSNRLSALAGKDIFTYEILNVTGRAGIRIHSANYYYQLKGCIALGSATKDINADGELDVIHSGATVQQFNDLMKAQPFLLVIK